MALTVDKNYADTPRQFDYLPSGKPAFDAPLPSRTPARTPAKAIDIRQAFRLLAQRQMKRPKPHPQPLPEPNL